MAGLGAYWIIENEPMVRAGAFVAIFVLIAILEIALPRRTRGFAITPRRISNLSIAALNTLIIRLLFPIAAVGTAVVADARGWGLLNQGDVPLGIAVVASILILDLVIWAQHRLLHAVPLFWRVHRVHHADRDYDLTTGLRFHPLEIIGSMLIKMLVIVILGAPVVAVILFEVLLNATSIFNHGNIHLKDGFDRILRLILVTPDMHRVHHSIDTNETNANFGFNLPWWDRLFGTYRDQPAVGHDRLVVGIPETDDPRDVDRLAGMLALPFSHPPGGNDRGQFE